MDITQKGLAGEFYALAQLTARGYNASLTLGNTKGVDILVMNKNNVGYKVDKEIDKMVYDLYELTKEEVEIVENS